MLMQQLQEQERQEPDKQVDQLLIELRYLLSVIEGYTQIVKQIIGARHPVYSKLMEIEKAASKSIDVTRSLPDIIEKTSK
jgi:hypothetical protein